MPTANASINNNTCVNNVEWSNKIAMSRVRACAAAGVCLARHRAMITAEARVEGCEHTAWEAEDVLRAISTGGSGSFRSNAGAGGAGGSGGSGLGNPLLDDSTDKGASASGGGDGPQITWWDGTSSSGLSYAWHCSLRPAAARGAALGLAAASLLVVAAEALALADAANGSGSKPPLETEGWSPAACALCVAALLGCVGPGSIVFLSGSLSVSSFLFTTRTLGHCLLTFTCETSYASN